MTGNLIRYELRDGVAVLTLNNPGRRNALSTELLNELKGLLHDFESDVAVRVIVLRSEGPVFSSGHDLNEIINRDAEAFCGVRAMHRSNGSHPVAAEAGNRASAGIGDRRRLPVSSHLRLGNSR